MFDYDEVLNNIITGALNIVKTNYSGFVINDDMICTFNAIVIVNHTKNLTEDYTKDMDSDKMIELYNHCIDKPMFSAWDANGIFDNSINSYYYYN
jgi:hypothetical protein|nr:MAG TPA: hypothetical protein [Crassvirales sp.]